MASAGLLMLLDDLATMTKVAAQKTMGISGDDLAVNSQALISIPPHREIPIVTKVAVGSLKNKAILVPCALLLGAVAPWSIVPLLAVGGAFLCYEGVEKLMHKHHEEKAIGPVKPLSERSAEEQKAIEDKTVKSAIRTDFILSAEIVAVTLGAVAAAPLLSQTAVLATVGLGMTVGVYGLVGGIVRLDDAALKLTEKKGDGILAKYQRSLGQGMLKGIPYLMKTISTVGTAAIFVVGGGILAHATGAGHAIEAFTHSLTGGGFAGGAVESVAMAVAGVAAGFTSIPVAKGIEKTVGFCREKCSKLFSKAPKQTVAKTVTPTEPSIQPSALDNTTSLSSALNNAAQRIQSETKNSVTPPVNKPEQPKPA